MIRIPIPTGALLAGAALAHLPDRDATMTANIASTEAMPTDITAAIPANTPVSPQNLLDATRLDVNALIPRDQEWNKKKERRFLQLAEKEAVGKLNAAEGGELDQLSEFRNASKVPRSGEEILREFKHRQVTHDLLQALQRYVDFNKTPHHQTP